MRTLLIAGLGAVLTTTGSAEAQRMIQRGPGASYPVPGRGMVGAPVGRPGPSLPPTGSGYRPGGPVGGPGQPGFGPGFRPGEPVGGPGQPGFGPGRPGAGFRHDRPGYGLGRPAYGGSHRGGHWQNRDGRWIGGWNAPGGWNGYRRPYSGWALPPYWVQPGFGIADWGAYGLAQPPYGYSWSRYYDDAVLIDARGSVYDTVGGIDWDDGFDDGYSDGDRFEDRGPPPGYGVGYPIPPRDGGYAGGRWVSPDGSTTVTTNGGYYGGGGSTTVVVRSAPTVTTTTNEIVQDDVTYTRHRPSAVRRHWRPTKTICRC